MSFTAEVKRAKQFYFQRWRGKEKPAPAFGGEVVRVGGSGWRHIRYARIRPRRETLRRMRLLKEAKRIIETRKRFDEHRKQGVAEFWSFKSRRKGKAIWVVVRSVKKGPKHFFSVFTKRLKKTRLPLSSKT